MPDVHVVHKPHVPSFAGFAAASTPSGGRAPVVTRGFYTSNDHDFEKIIRGLWSMFIPANKPISPSSVSEFVFIRREDGRGVLLLGDVSDDALHENGGLGPRDAYAICVRKDWAFGLQFDTRHVEATPAAAEYETVSAARARLGQALPPVRGTNPATLEPRTFQGIRGTLDDTSPAFAEVASGLVMTAAPGRPVRTVNFLLVTRSVSGDIHSLINEFSITQLIRAKGNIQAGAGVTPGMIADILRTKVEGIELGPTDRVALLVREGWSFAIVFDVGEAASKTLDLDLFERATARAQARMIFRSEHRVIEDEPLMAMLAEDGWFPFTEILGREFDDLLRMYESGDVERIPGMLDSWLSRFKKERLDSLVARWTRRAVHRMKGPLLQAGVQSYCDGNYVAAVKILCSELEGILRHQYQTLDRPKSHDLTAELRSEGEASPAGAASLAFPRAFQRYLNEFVFRGFDLAAEDTPFSRNSVLHGVATPDQYSASRALQYILCIDQVFWLLQTGSGESKE